MLLQIVAKEQRFEHILQKCVAALAPTQVVGQERLFWPKLYVDGNKKSDILAVVRRPEGYCRLLRAHLQHQGCCYRQDLGRLKKSRLSDAGQINLPDVYATIPTNICQVCVLLLPSESL